MMIYKFKNFKLCILHIVDSSFYLKISLKMCWDKCLLFKLTNLSFLKFNTFFYNFLLRFALRFSLDFLSYLISCCKLMVYLNKYFLILFDSLLFNNIFIDGSLIVAFIDDIFIQHNEYKLYCTLYNVQLIAHQ